MWAENFLVSGNLEYDDFVRHYRKTPAAAINMNVIFINWLNKKEERES